MSRDVVSPGDPPSRFMPENGRRPVIALLTNDAGLGLDYQGWLRRGVERECVARDFDLLVFAARTDFRPGDPQGRLFELVHPSRVNGIVVAAGCIATYSAIDRVVDRLLQHRIPAVSVGTVSARMPSLRIDNERGAAAIVDHLVSVHRRRAFAYIAGPAGHEESDQRLAGTRAALARHRLELEPSSLVYGSFTPTSGARAIRELIARRIDFDAVVAASDDMALGAFEALRDAGIDCPAEVSLVGFDDSASARVADLPLTTVRQPVSALGASAVARLVDLWEGREASATLTLDTELIVRESCGCLPLEAHRAGRRCREMLPCEAGRSELIRLLKPLVDGEEQRETWADRLQGAVAAERRGTAGALSATLETLARQASDLHLPLHELQPVITSLRNWSPPDDVALEDVFHAARVTIAGHAARRAGEHLMRGELLLEEVRTSWERLATALTLPALKRELTAELPRLAIRHALVSLFVVQDPEWLVPLVCLRDGQPVELPEHRYPAQLLIPEGAFAPSARRSLVVLPLTFESEPLGVAVLELPRPLQTYTLLREQIGSAVKTVQLHQEILYKERLHALAEEEERVTNERLQSLALIAGGVAHDLNNALGPLVALPDTIQADLRALGESCPVPAAVLEDLESIRQAGHHAALTIRDLLALGRPRESPTSTVELNRLLERERRSFAKLCETAPQLEFRVTTTEQKLLIRASKPHLVRAISNLIINAAEAIQGPGAITLRAAERELDAPFFGLERIEPGRYALIEVSDTGPGIPPEHLPRILEPFYSTRRHSSRSGTGLGLAIVQRIVKDSMGYVHVESAPDQGTRFELYFPLETSLMAVSSAPPPAAVGGRERILVVDDEPVQLRTARRILEHLGYDVVGASSGQQALALIEAASRDNGFDLMVIDLVMPGGLNGLATLERVRRLQPSQRALLVTGYAPDQIDVQAGELRLGWLAKPYNLASLAAAVRAALLTPAC